MKPKFCRTYLNEKIYFILLLILQLLFVLLQHCWFSYEKLDFEPFKLVPEHPLSFMDQNFYLILSTLLATIAVLLQKIKIDFQEALFLLSLYLFSFQFGIIMNAFFEQAIDRQFGKYELDSQTLCLALDSIFLTIFSLEEVFVSLSPLHWLLIIILEIPAFCLNKQLTRKIIGTLDEGYTIVLFFFCGFFIHPIKRVLQYISPKVKIAEKIERDSENILYIRILILVIFAPLFSSLLEQRNSQIENFINNLLSLSCSIVSAYICTAFFRNNKFSALKVYRSVFAATISTASVSHVYLSHIGSISIGLVSGAMGVLKRKQLNHLLNSPVTKKQNFYNELLYLPAFLGGLFTVVSSIIVIRSTDPKIYNRIKHFPAGSKQPLSQLFGILVTFLIAKVSGILSSKFLIFLTTKFELPFNNANLSRRTYQYTKINTSLKKEMKVWGNLNKKSLNKHNSFHLHHIDCKEKIN
ncbi:rh50 [Anaeramoeba flamelloides]|uniref:Rh50 n=1 Tax=Anaeramoeba flamelloides TaxID=1746091 RepID=A0ABQ8X9S7_9EUKA|nr:rh50 [Anaeramoeba flamelloides]